MKMYEFVDMCLSKIGVEKVFGLPGSLIMPLWQNLTNKEIVLCSHEQEASYVATGYAKMSKKPVCVITTGGPGVTNCISGIASANIDSVPLIFISGRTPLSKNGYGLNQEEGHVNRLYDSTDILSGVTKRSILIDRIEDSAEKIWNTIRMAVEERCGAVHLSIPVDYQSCEIDTIKINSLDNELIQTEKEIDISKRPIFVIGWGCWMSDAYDLVYELSEKVNAPIVVSSKAYCCIKSKHKYYLGKLGYGYTSIVDEFIKNYNPDSIISFGSSLGEKDIKGSFFQTLIHKIPVYFLGNDCRYANYRSSNAVVIETPDLNGFVRKICKNISVRGENIALIQDIDNIKKQNISFWCDKMESSDNMAKSIEYMNDIIDRNCVISADAGNHLLNAGALINHINCGQMFLDVGLRAMGTGICSSIGMAIADKTKIYLAITGDGSMLMNGNVMHIAFEQKLPIIFIVFNNHSLGRVRVGQSIMNEYRSSDIKNVDFISYGKAFGLDTYKFSTVEEFKDGLIEIISKRNPSLVEVITGNDEIPIPIKNKIF